MASSSKTGSHFSMSLNPSLTLAPQNNGQYSMKTYFPVFPALSTKRLTLKAIGEIDIPTIFVHRSDERMLKYTEISKAKSLDDAAKFISIINENNANGESLYWGIYQVDSNELIGTACLWNFDTEKGMTELGYSLHPDFWGKGLASEAVNAVVDFGFEKMGINVIQAFSHRENIPSLNLLTRLGFVKTGDEDNCAVFALCRPPLGQFLLETERLSLREIMPNDAPFLLELLNTPDWIANIGDRKVHNLDDARKYIIHRLKAAYQKFGFGFWLLERKTDSVPVGIAGLVKRDFLEDVDIGYALLPRFYGQGYAVEAAEAIMSFAKQKLALPRLAAITIETNKPSQRVLEKIGLRFEQMFQAPDDEEELMLYGVNFK